ncbi:nitrite reductase small subunit NirD [Nocardioides sp. 503]|uniref:nitrite reductase small subunit NirD n=1 Tax=Nocardioides sp. 503 TaxID=2508326 RepID=UPI0010705A1B|nr:nitrite reductase small subunit NirD [Nocardioides sp. 503]
MTTTHAATYTTVCRLDDIEPEGGVLALVAGEAVAVFRTYDDRVFALSNYDPYSRASVLARGIVGTRTVEGDEVTFVASPMHKQAFDLSTGQCLDDAAVRVPTYDVQVTEDGTVLIGGLIDEPAARLTGGGTSSS